MALQDTSRGKRRTVSLQIGIGVNRFGGLRLQKLALAFADVRVYRLNDDNESSDVFAQTQKPEIQRQQSGL